MSYIKSNKMKDNKDPKKACLQLLGVSFISLFLELMIIRWVPALVRVIGYYANLMLISSFLGIGLGALLERKKLNIFNFFPYILLANITFLIICQNITLPGFSIEYRYYSVSPNIINFVAVIGIFLFNTAVFVTLGEKIGQLFNSLPPLRAYSWDLSGSLLGTLTFGFFSFKFFSPLYGFLIVAVLYLILTSDKLKLNSLLLLLSLVFVFFSTTKEAIWSPYYYITIKDDTIHKIISIKEVPNNIGTIFNPPRFQVIVNNGFLQHQGTINAGRYTKGSFLYYQAQNDFVHTTLPFITKPSPERVLVVGAGGGKDVEAALLLGAKQVDAVEIDPVLINLSKKINASGIYFDPRVKVEINDARAFFTNAKPVYDLITFAYLDASALFSSMSNIRIDGYIYTVESLRKAYELVNEKGLLSISFAAGPAWVQKKLVLMMYKATGKVPIVYTVGGKFPVDGSITIQVAKGNLKAPEAHGVFRRANIPPQLWNDNSIYPATDDWPFLYLLKKGIPIDYLVVITTLILITSLILFRATRLKWGIYQTHFFFLGAGFLLLETKSITDCSLYFGSTWFVTMVIVAGILSMVLVANVIAMRLRSFHGYFYLPLIASMLLLYITPHDVILSFSFAGRLLWVLVFVPLPILFAGLVFSTTFREAENAASSFGANLLGATVGGFAEYSGMAIGFQNLSLIVIAAYLASLVIMLRIHRN